MKYFVEDYSRRIYKEFATYQEAEFYCWQNGIGCDEIYEIKEVY